MYIVGFPRVGETGSKKGEIQQYSQLPVGENLLFSHFFGGVGWVGAKWPFYGGGGD